MSNNEGGELSDKRTTYAQIGVPYYVVFDPNQELSEEILYVFGLLVRSYIERSDAWFPEVGLGLALWQGTYEGYTATWLRWCLKWLAGAHWRGASRAGARARRCASSTR